LHGFVIRILGGADVALLVFGAMWRIAHVFDHVPAQPASMLSLTAMLLSES
jgi:hypothetical protein